VHAVFTVPPWLKFVLPGTVQITLLSTVHLWNNDTARTRCEPAWKAFRSLVERRLGKEGLLLLFGKRPVGQRLVDDVIAVCGGHFRIYCGCCGIRLCEQPPYQVFLPPLR
jgi:hypothetical protein